jgi:nucleotide-binding universal stress UspA family protein
MNDSVIKPLSSAINDFRRARRQAGLQGLYARLTGRSNQLLSFDAVSRRVGAQRSSRSYLAEVPLDAIIGSVGRYEDFTRAFLPRRDSDESRWAGVKVAAEIKGLPPIEVYKLGEAYFVLDGNHRVSVARQLGAATIEANVTEFESQVALKTEDDYDAVLLKAERSEFLRDTKLGEREELDFTVTVPGRYPELLEHISVHLYYLGRDQEREISFPEAAASWVDTVYLPVLHAIRQSGILHYFPNRTETDLYLWLARHRAALQDSLGWELEPQETAAHLADRLNRDLRKILTRAWTKVRDALTPKELEPGPPPGAWRRDQIAPHDTERLFAAILVSLGKSDPGGVALEQALQIAKREGARLRALHVVAREEETESEATRAMQAHFERRCAEEGVAGSFAYEVGQVSQALIRRAVWNDLVVVHLRHPPPSEPLGRLRSGLRLVLQRSPRPVIAVPQAAGLRSALLAYDGSPKSEEALYLSAYLAAGWGLSLSVVTNTQDEGRRAASEERVRNYLKDNQVDVAFIRKAGPPGTAILEATGESGSDLILMGGYGAAPLVNVLASSTVNYVLRGARVPVWVCQ